MPTRIPTAAAQNLLIHEASQKVGARLRTPILGMRDAAKAC